MSFKSLVARGAAWTLVKTGGDQFLSFFIFVVLARLLTPVEFGVVALATVFTEVGRPAIRAGLSAAIIQRKTVTSAQADTAFWMAMVIGVLLFLAVASLAGPISKAFDEAQLEEVLRVLPVVFVILALGVIHDAKLRREFRFKAIAGSKILATLLSGGLGVWMAVEGFGVWSLVTYQILHEAIYTGALWAVLRWLPGFEISRKEMLTMFRFGLPLICAEFLNKAKNRVNDLIIGLFLGAGAVGFFRVAMRAINMLSNVSVRPVMGVALPTFSRLQDDPKRLKKYCLSMCRATSAISIPIVLGVGVLAPEFIRILLGEQWAQSEMVLRVLSILAFTLGLHAVAPPLILSAGKAGWTAGIRTMELAITALFAILAVPYGITAMAGAFVLSNFLILPIALIVATHFTQIRALSILRAVTTPVLAGLVMVVSLMVLRGLLIDTLPTLAFSAAIVGAGALLYLGFILIFDRPLIMELRGIVRSALPKSLKRLI